MVDTDAKTGPAHCPLLNRIRRCDQWKNQPRLWLYHEHPWKDMSLAKLVPILVDMLEEDFQSRTTRLSAMLATGPFSWNFMREVKLCPCPRMVNGVATRAPWLEHVPSSWSAQKFCTSHTSRYSSAASCWIFFHDAWPADQVIVGVSNLLLIEKHHTRFKRTRARICTHAWIMRMGFLDGGQASFCGAVHQLTRCGQAPGCATGEEAAIGSLKGTKSWEDKKISDGTKQAKQFRSSTKRPLWDDRYFLICWILRGSLFLVSHLIPRYQMQKRIFNLCS